MTYLEGLGHLDAGAAAHGAGLRLQPRGLNLELLSRSAESLQENPDIHL
jgi:hypothetical protein